MFFTNVEVRKNRRPRGTYINNDYSNVLRSKMKLNTKQTENK